MEEIRPKPLAVRNLAEEIQICYPSEPNWDAVEDATLVLLVEDFMSEPSCATIAIGLLASRRHPQATELAHWLCQNDYADEWLKASANDVLYPE